MGGIAGRARRARTGQLGLAGRRVARSASAASRSRRDARRPSVASRGRRWHDTVLHANRDRQPAADPHAAPERDALTHADADHPAHADAGADGSAHAGPNGSAATPRTYVVQQGDTLASIAQQFGTTVAAIRSANGIADPNEILIGQVLVIPSAGFRRGLAGAAERRRLASADLAELAAAAGAGLSAAEVDLEELSVLGLDLGRDQDAEAVDGIGEDGAHRRVEAVHVLGLECRPFAERRQPRLPQDLVAVGVADASDEAAGCAAAASARRDGGGCARESGRA